MIGGGLAVDGEGGGLLWQIRRSSCCMQSCIMAPFGVIAIDVVLPLLRSRLQG